MSNACPECGGVLVNVTKDIAIAFPNPGTRLITSDCLECVQCRTEVFDEKQSIELAKKIDQIVRAEHKSN